MSLVGGRSQPHQMYHSLPGDFYSAASHHHQQQQQQQRYHLQAASAETLSAAAAAAAGLHPHPHHHQIGGGMGTSPTSAATASENNNATNVAYFQNLMFNSQPYATDYNNSVALSSAGTELNLAPAADGVYGPAPNSNSGAGSIYMNYDELPLLLAGGTGNGIIMGEDGTVPRVRTVKRRVSSNRKERRRTHSINTAFAALRGCIPNVPSDTKLSKIKTLRLATSYIAYLMDILNKDDPLLAENGFKADISRKLESREEKRKRESEEILKAISAHGEEKPSKGRTGWPQQVWAAELKQ